ncbi:hypothetical protein [Pseudonocardia sp. ICBG1293]|uniref:WXG100-like domain-containing protein n=1 Tax=Pseudonocardia sp. ICBG1293 TaxID=2844382 RepID=UPI001CCE8AB6|nr:hypothetical protein [Pseudonocardia sp. ICBG1293]
MAGEDEVVRLPPELQTFFEVTIGLRWPEGSEAGLKAIAGAWYDFAEALDDSAGDASTFASDVDGAMEGDTAQALGSFIKEYLQSPMLSYSDAARELGKTAQNSAADIQKQKILFITMAAIAFATVVFLLSTLIGALFAPIVISGVRVALWAALKELINKLLTNAPKMALKFLTRTGGYVAGETAFEVALDGGIQLGQLADHKANQGDGEVHGRTEIDTESIKNAAIGGAVNGAVLGGAVNIMRGVGDLANDRIAAILKGNLDDLNIKLDGVSVKGPDPVSLRGPDGVSFKGDGPGRGPDEVGSRGPDADEIPGKRATSDSADTGGTDTPEVTRVAEHRQEPGPGEKGGSGESGNGGGTRGDADVPRLSGIPVESVGPKTRALLWDDDRIPHNTGASVFQKVTGGGMSWPHKVAELFVRRGADPTLTRMGIDPKPLYRSLDASAERHKLKGYQAPRATGVGTRLGAIALFGGVQMAVIPGAALASSVATGGDANAHDGILMIERPRSRGNTADSLQNIDALRDINLNNNALGKIDFGDAGVLATIGLGGLGEAVAEELKDSGGDDRSALSDLGSVTSLESRDSWTDDSSFSDSDSDSSDGGRSDDGLGRRDDGAFREEGGSRSDSDSRNEGSSRSDDGSRDESGRREDGAPRSEGSPRDESEASRSEDGSGNEPSSRTENGSRGEGVSRSDGGHRDESGSRSEGDVRADGGNLDRTVDGSQRGDGAPTETGGRGQPEADDRAGLSARADAPVDATTSDRTGGSSGRSEAVGGDGAPPESSRAPVDEPRESATGPERTVTDLASTDRAGGPATTGDQQVGVPAGGTSPAGVTPQAGGTTDRAITGDDAAAPPPTSVTESRGGAGDGAATAEGPVTLPGSPIEAGGDNAAPTDRAPSSGTNDLASTEQGGRSGPGADGGTDSAPAPVAPGTPATSGPPVTTAPAAGSTPGTGAPVASQSGQQSAPGSSPAGGTGDRSGTGGSSTGSRGPATSTGPGSVSSTGPGSVPSSGGPGTGSSPAGTSPERAVEATGGAGPETTPGDGTPVPDSRPEAGRETAGSTDRVAAPDPVLDTSAPTPDAVSTPAADRSGSSDPAGGAPTSGRDGVDDATGRPGTNDPPGREDTRGAARQDDLDGAVAREDIRSAAQPSADDAPAADRQDGAAPTDGARDGATPAETGRTTRSDEGRGEQARAEDTRTGAARSGEGTAEHRPAEGTPTDDRTATRRPAEESRTDGRDAHGRDSAAADSPAGAVAPPATALAPSSLPTPNSAAPNTPADGSRGGSTPAATSTAPTSRPAVSTGQPVRGVETPAARPGEAPPAPVHRGGGPEAAEEPRATPAPDGARTDGETDHDSDPRSDRRSVTDRDADPWGIESDVPGARPSLWVPELSPEVRGELRRAMARLVPGLWLPDGAEFDHGVAELRAALVADPEQVRMLPELPTDRIGTLEARTQAEFLVHQLVKDGDGSRQWPGLRGGAGGPELEVADIRLDENRARVQGTNVRMVTDALKDGTPIVEVVGEPSAWLRGEQGPPSLSTVWREIGEFWRRLSGLSDGQRITTVFPERDGFRVQQPQTRFERPRSGPPRINPQVTLGVSVFGLSRLHDVIATAIPLEGNEAAKNFRVFHDGLDFGKTVADRFRAYVDAAPPGKWDSAAARRADETAVRAHAATIYHHAAVAAGGWNDGLIKNDLLFLSRTPAAADRAALPERVQQYLDSDAAELTSLFDQKHRGHNPDSPDPLSVPLGARLEAPPEVSMGPGQAGEAIANTLRDYLRQAWQPLRPDEDPILQSDVAGPLKTELDGLDAFGGRADLPLRVIELRLLATASGADALEYVFGTSLRLLRLSRGIDDAAWRAAAASRSAQDGPAGVFGEVPQALPGPGTTERLAPVTVPVGAPDTVTVDGPGQDTAREFARRALDEAVELVFHGADRLVVHVEWDGDRGPAGQATAAAVRDLVEEHLDVLRAERGDGFPKPVPVEVVSSRLSRADGAPVGEDHVRIRVAEPQVSSGHIMDDAQLDAAVLAPFVAAALTDRGVVDARPNAADVRAELRDLDRSGARPEDRVALVSDLAQRMLGDAVPDRAKRPDLGSTVPWPVPPERPASSGPAADLARPYPPARPGGVHQSVAGTPEPAVTPPGDLADGVRARFGDTDVLAHVQRELTRYTGEPATRADALEAFGMYRQWLDRGNPWPDTVAELAEHVARTEANGWDGTGLVVGPWHTVDDTSDSDSDGGAPLPPVDGDGGRRERGAAGGRSSAPDTAAPRHTTPPAPRTTRAGNDPDAITPVSSRAPEPVAENPALSDQVRNELRSAIARAHRGAVMPTDPESFDRRVTELLAAADADPAQRRPVPELPTEEIGRRAADRLAAFVLHQLAREHGGTDRWPGLAGGASVPGDGTTGTRPEDIELAELADVAERTRDALAEARTGPIEQVEPAPRPEPADRSTLDEIAEDAARAERLRQALGDEPALRPEPVRRSVELSSEDDAEVSDREGLVVREDSRPGTDESRSEISDGDGSGDDSSDGSGSSGGRSGGSGDGPGSHRVGFGRRGRTISPEDVAALRTLAESLVAADRRDAEAGSDRPRRRLEVVGDGRGRWWDAGRREQVGDLRAEETATRLREILAEVPGGRDVVVVTRAAASLDPADQPPRSASAVVSVVAPEPRTVMGDRGGRVVGDTPPQVFLRAPDSEVDFEQVEAWVEAAGDPSRVRLWGVPEQIGPESFRRLTDLGVVLEDGAREVQENLGVDVRGLDRDARDALLKWVPQYTRGGIVVDRGVSPEGVDVRGAVPLPVRAGADLPYLPRLAEGRHTGTTGVVIGPRMSPAVNALLNAHRDSPARMLDDIAVEGVFARHLDPSSTTPLRQEFASGRYRAENPLVEQAEPVELEVRRTSEDLAREALGLPPVRSATPAALAPELADAIEMSALTVDGRLADPRATARDRHLRETPFAIERTHVGPVDGAEVRAQAHGLLDGVGLRRRALEGARAMVDAALSDERLTADLRRDQGAVQVVELGAKAEQSMPFAGGGSGVQGARIRVRTVAVEPDAEPPRRGLRDVLHSAERSLSDRRVSHGRGVVFSEPLTISLPLLVVHLLIRLAGLWPSRGVDLGSVSTHGRHTSVTEKEVEVDTTRHTVRYELELDLPGGRTRPGREATATVDIGRRTAEDATLRDPQSERPVWFRPDDILHTEFEGLDALGEQLRERLDIRVGDPAAGEIRTWLREMDQGLLTGPQSRTFSVASGPMLVSRPVTVTVGPTTGVAWWSHPPRKAVVEQRDTRTVETRYDRSRGRWRGWGLTVMGGVFFPLTFGVGGGPVYNRYNTTTTTDRAAQEGQVVGRREYTGELQRHDVRRQLFAQIASDPSGPTGPDRDGRPSPPADQITVPVTARLWARPEPALSTGDGDIVGRGVDPDEVTEGARARTRSGALHVMDEDSRDLVVEHVVRRLLDEGVLEPGRVDAIDGTDKAGKIDTVVTSLRQFLDSHVETVTAGRARFPLNEIVRGAPDVFIGASVGELSGRRHDVPDGTGATTTGTGQRDESQITRRKDANAGLTFQGYAQGLYYVSAGGAYKWGGAEAGTAAMLATATTETAGRTLHGWDYPASFTVEIGGSWSAPGPAGAPLPGRVGVIVPAPAADPRAGDAPGTGAATARWSDTAPEPFARRGNLPLRSENETVQQAPDLTVEAARLLQRPSAEGTGAVVRGILRTLAVPFVGTRPDLVDEPHRARRFFRHDPQRDGVNAKNAALEILESSTTPHVQQSIVDEAVARHRDVHSTTSGREGLFGQRADVLRLRQSRTLGNPRIVAVDPEHRFTHTVDPGVDVGRKVGTHDGWRGRVGALGLAWVLDYLAAGFGGDLQIQRLRATRSTSGEVTREPQKRTHTERGFHVVYDYVDEFEGRVRERVVDPFGIDHGLRKREHTSTRWVEVPGGLERWVPASEIHDVGVLDDASLEFLAPSETAAYRASLPEQEGEHRPDDVIPAEEVGAPGHVELHRSGVVADFHAELNRVLERWGEEQGASGPLKVLRTQVQDRDLGPTNDPARMEALLPDLLRNGWPLLVTATAGGRSLDLLVDVRGSLGATRRLGDAPSKVESTVEPSSTESSGQIEERKWSVRHDAGPGAFAGDGSAARPRMFAAYFVDYESIDTSSTERSTTRSSSGTDTITDRTRSVRDLDLTFDVHAVARRGSVLRRLDPLLERLGRGRHARADFTATGTLVGRCGRSRSPPPDGPSGSRVPGGRPGGPPGWLLVFPRTPGSGSGRARVCESRGSSTRSPTGPTASPIRT